MSKSVANIVVLDGYTLNPGDLRWNRLTSLADTAIYDRTPPEELIARARDATILLTNKAVIDRETIQALPRLEYIGVTATGTNVVDLAAARDRGVVVTNVPSYGTASVAQMVLAHSLNLAQRVGDHAALVREGRWSSSPDWCFWESPQVELAGLTMGIVGYGQIGREVARLADALGMSVLANNRTPVNRPPEVRMVELDVLFRLSDVVSLHCPLTDETAGIVSRKRLRLMKNTAWLINTGRGQLIDEEALAEALAEEQLAGAGLDVLSAEPPPKDHPLLTAPNCYITPHIAWATHGSRARLLEAVVENVAAFLAGSPRNVVA